MKPITAERRAEFQRLVDSAREREFQPTTLDNIFIANWIQELLDAEGYWRAAVTAASAEFSNECGRCIFCLARARPVMMNGIETAIHWPGCPWILAQATATKSS